MNPDPTKERKILDAIEDAEENLKEQKRLTRGLATAYLIILSTIPASILLASVFDTESWYIGAVVGGIASVLATVLAIIGWADGDFGTAKEKRKLRDARREHRNYLMDISS